MSIIDRILAVLAPYECLGCTAEGFLLCPGCIQQLTAGPEQCYRCHMAAPSSLTCTGCADVSSLEWVRPGTAYKGVAKDLIARLKFSGAQAAVRPMASRLAPMLPAGREWIAVPVPTATSRVRGRGYDQAKLLARELSRQTGLPYLDCLVRRGQTHQVGSSRNQRLRQLSGAFRITSTRKARGRRILLIDDVLTTGATLEAAAAEFKRNGAEQVAAIVFARA